MTLIFTYLIPIVPFILVLDGYVSAYRSREFEHVSLFRGVTGRGHTVLYLALVLMQQPRTSCYILIWYLKSYQTL